MITVRPGNPHLVGYARVSTRDQRLDVQLSALEAAGCAKIYAEKVSGAAAARPGWEACSEALRARDTIVVVRVDRLGRKLAELVRTLDDLREQRVNVRSLDEGIDTSQRGGRFAFLLVAALAEKVRDDIRENTRAGLAEARRRGQQLGRPSKMDAPKLALVKHLHGEGYSLRDIAKAVGVSPATVYKQLDRARQLPPAKQLVLAEVANG